MNCSTPGLPVHHQFQEFTQTHAHQVSDAIQPSHLLSSPSPPAPNPSQPYILSGVISPLISSSILGTYQPGEFLFQYPIILPFHTVHGVLMARILKWFAIPFSSGPHSVRPLSPPWPARPGWPHTEWLSFIELEKAVVRVIRLTRFLWLWFQCVCPLMPSGNTYCLGFLLPWTWGISSRLLQQSAATAPYLGWGVSPHHHSSIVYYGSLLN